MTLYKRIDINITLVYLLAYLIVHKYFGDKLSHKEYNKAMKYVCEDISINAIPYLISLKMYWDIDSYWEYYRILF